MEYILIAWFSLAQFDEPSSDTAYGYSMATSITQEFNSQKACEAAGTALRRKGVNTDMEHKIGIQPKAKWNYICVAKGESESPRPQLD